MLHRRSELIERLQDTPPAEQLCLLSARSPSFPLPLFRDRHLLHLGQRQVLSILVQGSSEFALRALSNTQQDSPPAQRQAQPGERVLNISEEVISMSSEYPRKKADQGQQASTANCDGNTAVSWLVPSATTPTRHSKETELPVFAALTTGV